MEDVQLGLVSSAVVWYWVLFLGYFFIIPLSFSLFSPSLLVIDLASFIRISRFLSSVLPPSLVSVSVSVLSSLSASLFLHKLLLVWCFSELNKLCFF